MKKLKLGLQLYTVRRSLAEDFMGTLTAVRDMGYEYVELAGYYDKSAEEIKSALDSLGLKCVSVHQKLGFFDPDPMAGINFLKTIGVKYVIIPWHNKEELAGTDKWNDTLATFNKYSQLFRENGMILGYHNHDFEFETSGGKYLHDYIMEGVEGIVPEIDTCWVKYAGLDPAAKVRQFAGNVEIVHLKDFFSEKMAGGPVYDLISTDGKTGEKKTSRENSFEFRPVGYGVQNFGEILDACKESGTNIVIVEQDHPSLGMNDIESAKASIEYLKNNFDF